MDEELKNAAEIVYYTLASVYVAMQIQEMLEERHKKKPSIKRKGRHKRQKRK